MGNPDPLLHTAIPVAHLTSWCAGTHTLIKPLFLIDRRWDRLEFDGQQFRHRDGRCWPRAALACATRQRRYFGPLLLFYMLGAVVYALPRQLSL